MTSVTFSGFGMLAWVSTCIDLGVALTVLFGRGRDGRTAGRVIGVRRILWAVAVTAAVFAVKLVPWLVVGLDRFGLIRLVYLALVILVPCAALAVLLAPRWRTGVRVTGPARLIARVCCVPAAVGLWATYIEPFRLCVETAAVDVPRERGGTQPVRIGVLADIQTDRVTDYEHDAVARLMAQRPDVIVLPGDLFQGTTQQFDEQAGALTGLLSRLSAPGGVFFVLGDMDAPDEIRRVIAGTQVRVLVNDIARVTMHDRQITLAGIELNCHSEAAQRTIRRLETADSGADVRILIAHYPDVVFGLPPSCRVDLVVAGHTHGGQVCIPFFGPPITLTHVPRSIAAGGLHQLDARRIYVSRGVGCERGQAPRLRFFCPPEVAVLTIR